jgi:hypothetical protein
LRHLPRNTGCYFSATHRCRFNLQNRKVKMCVERPGVRDGKFDYQCFVLEYRGAAGTRPPDLFDSGHLRPPCQRSKYSSPLGLRLRRPSPLPAPRSRVPARCQPMPSMLQCRHVVRGIPPKRSGAITFRYAAGFECAEWAPSGGLQPHRPGSKRRLRSGDFFFSANPELRAEADSVDRCCLSARQLLVRAVCRYRHEALGFFELPRL